jgi:Fic-DOC domain mobile mystery protein B
MDFKQLNDATPIFDCSDLIPIEVQNQADLNRVEAENIFKAIRKFLHGKIDVPEKWFVIPKLKAIHGEMFDEVWTWAGSFSQSTTSIGVSPHVIPAQLAHFCSEVHSWFQHPVQLTFVEMAARIHHRLVSIHPFENGNGRFSRLIADRFLLTFKCPYPIWPDSLHQEGSVRTKYIQALKNADKGNYETLVNFMKQFGAKDPSLNEFLENKLYQPHVKSIRGASTVEALLKNGGNPNDETESGQRILQYTIKANLDDIAMILIHHGADLKFNDKSNQTPYQCAIDQGNVRLADFMATVSGITPE